VKAFTTYSVTVSSPICSDPSLSIVEEDTQDSPAEENIFKNVHNCLELDCVSTDDDLKQLEYELLPHERCATHTQIW